MKKKMKTRERQDLRNSDEMHSGNEKRLFYGNHQLLPKAIADGVLIFVSFYTVSQFYKDPEFYNDTTSLLFYFIPSIVILVLLFIVSKNRFLGGILFVLLSYGLFFPYRIGVGLVVSLALFIAGVFFMMERIENKSLITKT